MPPTLNIPPLLPQTFYLRPAEEVAPDLLGRLLCRDGIVLMVTEVEAYGGQEDTASHCRFGRTARNAPMWGPGGYCYVYLCYGIHWMLNVVTGREGEGAAVLVRSCEVLEGFRAVMERRRVKRSAAICRGPGKVAQALALDGSYNGHPLFEPGGLELREWARLDALGPCDAAPDALDPCDAAPDALGPCDAAPDALGLCDTVPDALGLCPAAPDTIERTKRIGIDYADENDRSALLRFVGVWGRGKPSHSGL